MIDLKSALESVQYNTGALGNSNSSVNPNNQTNQEQNAGTLASILKRIAPSLIGGGNVPPVA